MPATLEAREASRVLDLLMPLVYFYNADDLPLPSVEFIEGPAMPEPYRSLLVHSRDMTPTLAAAFACTLELRVLEHVRSGNSYSRRIVLLASGRTVLFGAIKIYLDRFPPAARDLILADTMPFGAILQASGIVHSSSPIAFFEIEADTSIAGALGLTAPRPLFGRRNVLSNARAEPLAQVFEVLAPHDPAWKLDSSGDSARG